MKLLKNYFFRFLKFLNIKIVKYDFFVEIDNERKINNHKLRQLEFIFLNDRVKEYKKLHKYLQFSKSQIFQDLFVINELNFKTGGYFIEIGAADGMNLSNTYMLENIFNWEGVVVEPAKIWKEKLFKNRNCEISYDCIYFESNLEINFMQTTKPEFSSLDVQNKPKDIHESFRRKNNETYKVKTISFNDFAVKFNLPKKINYISIDTEGTEFDILKSINLDNFDIDIFSIEHNYSSNRDSIYNYMIQNGYIRVLENFSKFDDWYIKDSG